MCAHCFKEHWESRDPIRFHDSLTPERRRAVEHAKATLQAVADLDPDWNGGPLHVAVMDDNYDRSGLGGYYDERPDVAAAEAVAVDAWEPLSVDERSIVVAKFHEYDITRASLAFWQDVALRRDRGAVSDGDADALAWAANTRDGTLYP